MATIEENNYAEEPVRYGPKTIYESDYSYDQMHQPDDFLCHLDCVEFADRLKQLVNYPDGRKYFDLDRAIAKLAEYGYQVGGIPLMTNYIKKLSDFILTFSELGLPDFRFCDFYDLGLPFLVAWTHGVALTRDEVDWSAGIAAGKIEADILGQSMTLF